MRFATISEMFHEFSRGRVSALYASAGTDTRPITFTHPEFFQHHGIEAPSPEFFVYVDRGATPPLSFDDAHTTITPDEVQDFEVGTLPARAFAATFRSDQYSDRTVHVVQLTGENEVVSAMMYRDRWVPDFFIGVADGCHAFGGNKHCVNDLRLHGADAATVAHAALPRWWITDHFNSADIPNPLPAGGVVGSTDEAFPVQFRKVALLSAQWGHYGRGSIPGATLFAVERVAA